MKNPRELSGSAEFASIGKIATVMKHVPGHAYLRLFDGTEGEIVKNEFTRRFRMHDAP